VLLFSIFFQNYITCLSFGYVDKLTHLKELSEWCQSEKDQLEAISHAQKFKSLTRLVLYEQFEELDADPDDEDDIVYSEDELNERRKRRLFAVLPKFTNLTVSYLPQPY
jgi:hypothetical protein